MGRLVSLHAVAALVVCGALTLAAAASARPPRTDGCPTFTGPFYWLD